VYDSGTAEVEIEVLGFNAKTGISSNTSHQFKEKYLGNIMLQIGVFSKMQTAKEVAKNNETQKYKAKINEYNKDGRVLYRVVLYNFKDENEAREFKKEMNLKSAFITGE
jgi:cell division septation protein DedD